MGGAASSHAADAFISGTSVHRRGHLSGTPATCPTPSSAARAFHLGFVGGAARIMAVRAEIEAEALMRDWLPGLDGGKGNMLQYFSLVDYSGTRPWTGCRAPLDGFRH